MYKGNEQNKPPPGPAASSPRWAAGGRNGRQLQRRGHPPLPWEQQDTQETAVWIPVGDRQQRQRRGHLPLPWEQQDTQETAVWIPVGDRRQRQCRGHPPVPCEQQDTWDWQEAAQFESLLNSSVNAGGACQYHRSNRTPKTGERLHSLNPCWASLLLSSLAVGTLESFQGSEVAWGCTVWIPVEQHPSPILSSLLWWELLTPLNVVKTRHPAYNRPLLFTLQFASWHPQSCVRASGRCPPLPVSLAPARWRSAVDCPQCLPGSTAGAGGRVKYQNGRSAVGESPCTLLSTLTAVRYHGSVSQTHHTVHWWSEFLHKKETSTAYFSKQINKRSRLDSIHQTPLNLYEKSPLSNNQIILDYLNLEISNFFSKTDKWADEKRTIDTAKSLALVAFFFFLKKRKKKVFSHKWY